MQNYKILACGGGTISHATPVVAVLDAWKKKYPATKILYIASRNGPEIEYVQGKFPFREIFAGKFYRAIDLRNIVSAIDNFIGLTQALFIFWRFKPDLVFAKGGYVAFPVALGAKIFKRKLIIHESDSIIGLTNKLSANYASRILTGFEKSNYQPAFQNKIEFTGIPLRQEFFSQPDVVKLQLPNDKKVLLALGGSQGAEGLNQWVMANIEKLTKDSYLVHLTGEKNWPQMKNFRRENYYSFPFLKEGLAAILKRADLVVSRAGATAISEFAYLKKPVVLVPYPFASQNHQKKNAEILAEKNAAVLIEQDDLNKRIDEIIALLNDDKKLKELAGNISEIMPKDSIAKIVSILEQELK